MDFSTRNNAMIQDNYEGPTRKTLSTCRGRITGVETQKKNNCVNTWEDADMIWDVDCNDHPSATINNMEIVPDL